SSTPASMRSSSNWCMRCWAIRLQPLRRPMATFSLTPFLDRLERADPMPLCGHVVRTVGLVVESRGPRARVGDVCELAGSDGEPPVPVEVVGFRDGYVLSIPL